MKCGKAEAQYFPPTGEKSNVVTRMGFKVNLKFITEQRKKENESFYYFAFEKSRFSGELEFRTALPKKM